MAAFATIAASATAEVDRRVREAALGRLLFFDPNLSQPAGQACASCHDPATAFADPDASRPTSKGVHRDRFGSRNTPTARYAAYSPPFHFDRTEGHYVGGQFWDGRAATLEAQAKLPFLDPLEMANPDVAAVVAQVRRAAYAGEFEALHGPGALDDPDRAMARIAAAIAAYERSAELAPFTSKHDAWLQGRAALSERELRGLRLFNDPRKGNCAACHPSQRRPDGGLPLFTDFTYDNLGVPANPDNPFYGLPRVHNPRGQGFVDRGLGAAVKRRAEDGKFKVPTLRNVALTAPYMHNGYFATLRGVVAFYNDRDALPRCRGRLAEAEALRRGCWPAPEVARNVNREEMGRLGLTAAEVDDIVAFLLTLTDGYRPERPALPASPAASAPRSPGAPQP
ncbi:MAG: c-type cytochrome [Rhodocyclaceae bacterium]|nr:c-type cytochrome [Rhodocyclaceae bacterium]